MFTLPLDENQLGRIDYNRGYNDGVPAFYKFEFEISEVADTFLDTDGFGKGVAFINGFNPRQILEYRPSEKAVYPGSASEKR